ncbi:unnamed protein product [Mytilus edulis]|uniref:Uncharacterized protein n=1 Tax=Mytilus edulis TaxID=6550 RepID=A0A8S3SSR7_MYTED|nr:unnamed protein product [Mytilus edulis]
MELLTPSGKPLEQLEIFQKRMLKQILSLPTRCPDPAVYILTGILPVEAQIHIKTLTFFNNVYHQSEESTMKKLARRQMTVCSEASNSWFININKLLRLYNLNEANTYLANPTKKTQWITLIKSAVMKYWSTKINPVLSKEEEEEEEAAHKEKYTVGQKDSAEDKLA